MSNKNPENQFKKGKSGNPKGRPSAGMSLTQLMKEHLEKIPEGSKISYKEAFISKVFARAYEGNDTYVKLVWNYVEGMPKQALEHSGPDGQPVSILIYKPEKSPDPDDD